MSKDPSDETNLESQIATIKREVDALQVNVMSGKKRWYETPATLIALSALAFSLGTTFISYYRTAQQDVLVSRIELRTLVEKISKIPQEHAQMLVEFHSDARVVAELSGHVNNRNLVLSRQAAAVIERIESSWFGRGSVIADEYMSVATGLMASGAVEDGEVYVREASKRAKHPASAAAALRALAGVFMGKGDVEAMRRYMKRSITIFAGPPFSNAPQLTKDVTIATTHIQWGGGELQLGECERAQSHLEQAQSLILRLLDSPVRGQLSKSTADIVLGIDNCRSGISLPQM